MQLPWFIHIYTHRRPFGLRALHSREDSRVLEHLTSDFRCLAWP